MQVYSASKKIKLTVAPSFTQTFAVHKLGEYFRVYVEGRSVRRYSQEDTGLYTVEGVHQIAAHYGFKVPAARLA